MHCNINGFHKSCQLPTNCCVLTALAAILLLESDTQLQYLLSDPQIVLLGYVVCWNKIIFTNPSLPSLSLSGITWSDWFHQGIRQAEMWSCLEPSFSCWPHGEQQLKVYGLESLPTEIDLMIESSVWNRNVLLPVQPYLCHADANVSLGHLELHQCW